MLTRMTDENWEIVLQTFRASDRRHARSSRPHQHDPRPPNQLLRRVAARHPAVQRRPILGR